MKNRTMTLEQAYRYVLRRVDRKIRSITRKNVRKAKRNERFSFCVWNRVDAMYSFVEDYGYNFVVIIDDGISYRKA